jgi:hypothetical protein
MTMKKLTKKAKQQKLASKYISEEMHTGKYPQKQAIAIGLSRARRAFSKKSLHTSRIQRIMKKYR